MSAILPDPLSARFPAFDSAAAVHKAARAAIKGQTGCVIWLTGLSGAGKSTIATHLEVILNEQGRHTCMLDGDVLREGLCRDLGFSPRDRAENVRRAAEAARLMVDAGLVTLVALISPFRSDRQAARALFDAGEFIEVYVDTPLTVAEARDPKGLYRRARQGLLPEFTGISSPYEAPEQAEVVVDTTVVSAEAAAAAITRQLRQRGLLGRG